MKKDNEWKLLGSESSLEKMAVKIGKYFFSSSAFVLTPTGEKDVYEILYPGTSVRAGRKLPNHRVVCVKGRYRFEINWEMAKKDMESKRKTIV